MTISSQGDRPLELPAGRSAGRLLGLLTAVLYGLFTLLPNSNSLIVSWPWVFVWQIMLLLAVLWALWPIGQTQRFTRLGLGFDWVALLSALVVIVSSLSSAHSQQARWYAWVFFAFLAALYGICTWLQSQPKPLAAIQSLLTVQGYLGAALIGVSLVVWLTDTVFPFREKAAQLRAAGVDIQFTFAENDLRNWAPLGHQNFVAGYLILLLPLFLLLAWQQRGKQRGFWLFVFGVGLIDFYTTSSRGGLLGLVVLMIFAVIGIGLQRNLPKIWGAGLSAGAIAILGILVWSNDRLQQTVGELLQGQPSSLLVYRSLNAAVGWQMGKQQGITGIGLGNVPLQYQQFRPLWAGRESELAYQLHSTPVQLFAELGVGGVMVASILGVGLIWQGLVQIRRTTSP